MVNTKTLTVMKYHLKNGSNRLYKSPRSQSSWQMITKLVELVLIEHLSHPKTFIIPTMFGRLSHLTMPRVQFRDAFLNVDAVLDKKFRREFKTET